MAAELFVGPVVEKLIDIGFQYSEGQYRWQTGMKEELESLRNNYHRIKAVDFASSRAQIVDQNPDFNKWLWQLRDAIDEADDVLDEFEYMNHETTSSSRLVKIVERALQIDPNLKRLEEIVKKLDNVLAGVGSFQHLLQMIKEEQKEQMQEFLQTRQTGSLPTDDLIGRGEDKEFVIQWLKKPSNEHQTTFSSNISLLSIVGHGGMGKTTLAQHVYSEMTTGFDLKIWVCVSTKFDAQKVIADMLEYIKKQKPSADSLGTLQESLKSEVESKKFLLVLDDIWAEENNNDKSKWKNVFAPLAFGSLGSKILITTRMYSVASMIAKLLNKKEGETILKLEGLKENTCLQLLKSHAFDGVDNPYDHEHLNSIAGKIVKKLSGSPLAAKVIGGALNESLDKRHWLIILNSDLMRAEPGEDILSVLRLSYLFLPKHLQNCFAFCCIFPQDHVFDKDDLARMWIALGFIQPSSYNQKRTTMEDIGGKYFDMLVRKSFFDKFEIYSKTRYKMHDLLHELAQSVSAEECFRIMNDEEFYSTNPETVRHLYVKTENIEMLKKIGNFKHLRSLFLTTNMDNKEIFDAFAEIFKSLRRIRLLYIHHANQNVFVRATQNVFVDEGIILKAIENLIHLRYFKFDEKYITQMPLPRSLSKLYHLKFIIYDRMRVLPLPKDCPSLISLGGQQKVETTEKYQLILNHLSISDPSVLLMEPLRSITLSGICISDNDELVSFPYEVEQWFRGVSESLCELEFTSLKSLQSLPSSLESLTFLKSLNIRKIPELQVLPKLPDSLERLGLYTLKSLQCLPPSLSSMSALKELDLFYIPLLKSLPDLPPSLESLNLNRLESLQCLPPSLSSMSALIRLRLIFIPLLKSLPDLPPSLEFVYIKGCHKELKERYDSTSGVDRDKFARIRNVRIRS